MHNNRQNRLVVNLVAFSWKLLARLARHVFWAGGWCRSTCGLAKIPSIHNVTFWSDRYMREHFEQTMRCQTHNGQEQECFWWIGSWQRLELQLSLNITIMTYHQSRWLLSGDLLWNNVAWRISQLFVIQEKSVKGIHLCQSLIPLSVPNPLDNLL